MSALPIDHPMTVPEYLEAVETYGWERTELVDGVVYVEGVVLGEKAVSEVAPQKNRHRKVVMRVLHALCDACPDDDVANTGSVDMRPLSMPEPDIYVIDGSAEQDDEGYLPVSAVRLVVEVSVTTLAYDLGPKLTAYAKAAVPEVWVIDPRPEAGWLQRHTHPDAGQYRTVQRFAVGENAAGLDVAAVRAPT